MVARSGVVDRRHRSNLSWELQWAELNEQKIVFSVVTFDGKGSKLGVCILSRYSSISEEISAQDQLTSNLSLGLRESIVEESKSESLTDLTKDNSADLGDQQFLFSSLNTDVSIPSSRFLSQTSTRRASNGFLSDALQIFSATRSGKVNSDRLQMKYPYVLNVSNVFIDGESSPSDLCFSVESLESKRAWLIAVHQAILNDHFECVLRMYSLLQPEVLPISKLLSMVSLRKSFSISSSSSPSPTAMSSPSSWVVSSLVTSLSQLSDVAIKCSLEVHYLRASDSSSIPIKIDEFVYEVGVNDIEQSSSTSLSGQPLSIQSMGHKPPRLTCRSSENLSISCPYVTLLMVNPDFQRNEKAKETFVHWIVINAKFRESTEVPSKITIAAEPINNDLNSELDNNDSAINDTTNQYYNQESFLVNGSSSVNNGDTHRRRDYQFTIDYQEAICEYVPPCPTYNSGINRMLVFVFKQNEERVLPPQPMDYDLPPRLLADFNIKQWQNSMNLGSLISITWFPVTYENCVDAAHTKFGIQLQSMFQPATEAVAVTTSTTSTTGTKFTTDADSSAFETIDDSRCPPLSNHYISKDLVSIETAATTSVAAESTGGEVVELSEVQFNKILASLRRADETTEKLASTLKQAQLDRDAASQQALISRLQFERLESRCNRIERLHSFVLRSISDLRDSSGSMEHCRPIHSAPTVSVTAVSADGMVTETMDDSNCTFSLSSLNVNEIDLAFTEEINLVRELLDWLSHFCRSHSFHSVGYNDVPVACIDATLEIDSVANSTEIKDESDARKSLDREVSDALLHHLVGKVEMNRMQSDYEEKILDLDFQVRTLQQSLADSNQQISDLLSYKLILGSQLENEKSLRLRQRDELEADVLDQLLSLKQLLGNKSEMCRQLERENEELHVQIAEMTRNRHEESALKGDRLKQLEKELNLKTDSWETQFKQQEELILNLRLLIENEKKAKQLINNSSIDLNAKIQSLSVENMQLKSSIEDAIKEKDTLYRESLHMREQFDGQLEELQSQLNHERSITEGLVLEAKQTTSAMVMECKDAKSAGDLWQHRYLDSESVVARLEAQVQQLQLELQRAGDAPSIQRLELENRRILAQVLDKSSVLGLKAQLNEALSDSLIFKAQQEQQASEYQLDIQTLSDKLCAMEFELEDERLTKDRLLKAESSSQEEVEYLRAEIERLVSKQHEYEMILFDMNS